MKLSITTLTTKTLSIMAYLRHTALMTLSINDIQGKYTWHKDSKMGLFATLGVNDTQHTDTEHKWLFCNTQNNDT
jgi:hypothetical protein